MVTFLKYNPDILDRKPPKPETGIIAFFSNIYSIYFK